MPRIADDRFELITEERTDDRELPWRTPRTPEELRLWLHEHLDPSAPEQGLIAGHHSPFEYLVHAFFEGAMARRDGCWVMVGESERTADSIVWANRGGGKTYLGAVATLLDLIFKPGVQARVLAGSLEQSGRMHTYLGRLLERPGISGRIDVRITSRSIEAGGGADANVLAASETSVRGTRVQKLRCDEVDLFHPDLWQAAQLVTRSASPLIGPWGDFIRGSVEALSTMHRPHGVMATIVDQIRGQGRPDAPPVFRWGVVDVLEVCPASRSCQGCGLLAECGGRAKAVTPGGAGRRLPGQGGHVTIDDALRLKSRVDRVMWETEMLSLRPRRTSAVFPEFDPATHVVDDGDARLDGVVRGPVVFAAAMDFGVRSESVVLLASVDERGGIVIEREAWGPDRPLTMQIATVREWMAAGYAGAVGAAPEWVAIDPAGLGRSDQSGTSNASVLRSMGWEVAAPRRPLAMGLAAVRARLSPAEGPPRLLVHERCRRLIECLRRFHYPDLDPRTDEPVKDGHDHACDALRYLVLSVDRRVPLAAHRY